MSDELIEEVARAIYESLNGSPTCYRWDDSGLDDEHPGARDKYYRNARAAIPVVRKAVLAEVAGWLRSRWADGPGSSGELWLADRIEKGDL